MADHPAWQKFRGWRVYRNLNSDSWTVQMYSTGRGWRKWRTCDQLYVDGLVWYDIYDTGRERVREQRRKNVHAYACIDADAEVFWGCYDDELSPSNAWNIKYNPYDHDGFRAIHPNGLTHTNILDSRGITQFNPQGLIVAQSITHGISGEKAS